MTELVTLGDRITYSQALAASDLLPRQYRAKPANVLVAVEYGQALGLAPMAAIQLIHVVEGTPTASAQLIGSLVRRAGHRLRVKGNSQHATATIVRSDDPDYEFSATWTLERAKRAELLGKSNWQHYPDAMLKARAITEVARDACPEVLAGVQYTEEELGADTVPGPSTTVTRDPVEPWPEPTADEVVEAEVVDEPDRPAGPPATAAQLTKIGAQCTDLGLSREARLRAAAAIVARPITTATQLTKAEAHEVIEAFEQVLASDDRAAALALLTRTGDDT